MKTLMIVKRIAAVCLLLAFVLPLSQCSQRQSNGSTQLPSLSTQAASPSSLSASAPHDSSLTYAYRADPNDTFFTLANYFAFIWPAIFASCLFVRPQLEQRLALRLIELVLCLVSALIILRLTGFGSLLFGGYLAWSALGLYSFTSLFAFLQRVAQTWNGKVKTSSC